MAVFVFVVTNLEVLAGGYVISYFVLRVPDLTCLTRQVMAFMDETQGLRRSSHPFRLDLIVSSIT